MQDVFGYCEQLVRVADKDRFLATLFAPAERRPALFALYAFNSEIARVREIAREPLPGEIRLQWWREVLAGERSGEAQSHPVAAALLQTLVRYHLPAAQLIELIEARGFDLYDDPMATVAELEAYAEKTGSALIDLAAKALGEQGLTADLANRAGIASVLTGVLKALPLHAARRQLYLPLELMRRYGADHEDLFAGRVTTELRTVLAELRLRARRHLDAAKLILTAAPSEALPAMLPVALVRPTLKRMERRYNPLQPREIAAWRRQWLLWRAARDPRRIA